MLKISYFDENGEIQFAHIQVPDSESYEWTYSKTSKADPNYESWDGKPVVKNRARYLSKPRIEEILVNQPDYIRDKIYAYNEPKKFFVDIEIKNDDEWPRPAVARHEITAISFAYKQLLVVLGLKPLAPDQIKNIENLINEYLATKNYDPIEFSYVYYKSEYDMLYTFFNKWIQKMPLITGWNFTSFDWAYMVNRCRKLSIDPAVASPSNKLVGRDELPLHRVVVDYLEIYKKWDRVVFKENNTLDYVAKQATGLGKIKYNGTLMDLYESDFMKYIYYNAIDSILVRLIDEKIATMDAFLKLGKITKCECIRVFSPISMTEAVLSREYYKRGKVFPLQDKRKPTKVEYEGAFVFEPKKGIYEWVASFDFASLYPSIMRQWNMSPENYLGKTDKITDAINFEQMVSYAASGAMFSTKEDSAFRVILTNFYGQRKAAKKIMEAVETEIDILKHMKEHIKKS
jgi:DNA polymerase elongation subunit (family B)